MNHKKQLFRSLWMRSRLPKGVSWLHAAWGFETGIVDIKGGWLGDFIYVTIIKTPSYLLL